mgnify:CR=1 FL=1
MAEQEQGQRNGAPMREDSGLFDWRDYIDLQVQNPERAELFAATLDQLSRIPEMQEVIRQTAQRDESLFAAADVEMQRLQREGDNYSLVMRQFLNEFEVLGVFNPEVRAEIHPEMVRVIDSALQTRFGRLEFVSSSVSEGHYMYNVQSMDNALFERDPEAAIVQALPQHQINVNNYGVHYDVYRGEDGDYHYFSLQQIIAEELVHAAHPDNNVITALREQVDAVDAVYDRIYADDPQMLGDEVARTAYFNLSSSIYSARYGPMRTPDERLERAVEAVNEGHEDELPVDLRGVAALYQVRLDGEHRDNAIKDAILQPYYDMEPRGPYWDTAPDSPRPERLQGDMPDGYDRARERLNNVDRDMLAATEGAVRTGEAFCEGLLDVPEVQESIESRGGLFGLGRNNAVNEWLRGTGDEQLAFDTAPYHDVGLTSSEAVTDLTQAEYSALVELILEEAREVDGQSVPDCREVAEEVVRGGRE